MDRRNKDFAESNDELEDWEKEFNECMNNS